MWSLNVICVNIQPQKKTNWGCTLKEYIVSVECVMLKLILKKSFKAQQERKHCNQCGKVVKYVWHKNHFVKKDIYGDIYDICGPECYVQFYNEVVDPPPPVGYRYGWFGTKTIVAKV